MKTEKKWITKTIQDAAKVKTKMPWERGTTRMAFIAKRKATQTAKRVTA
ncbi:hypothetical protein [Cognatishimia sp. MH4019]|nr:hypothetical protein [Cognatishimia sp. MH4019]